MRNTRDYGKKLSHDAVGYEHPAKGPHHCSQCQHYLGRHCSVVKDPIEPEDWCRKFEPWDDEPNYAT